MNPAGPVRVLIVDDSIVVRGQLARGLAAHGLEIAGVAADPYEARDLILQLKPDVLTLDIEMPRMNGLTFLERLMAFRPMPVVVLSSLSVDGSQVALRALELGALEALPKPSHSQAAEGAAAMLALAHVLRVCAGAKVDKRWTSALKQRVSPAKAEGGPATRLLALGASTGGTQALPQVLATPPPEGAACAIVQHMPAGFTQAFAERLDQQSPWRVREARNGERLTQGLALVAPGDQHLLIRRDSQGWLALLQRSPAVNHVRPSVDVLLASVAKAAGASAVGAILTGMGRDGAAGLLAMRQAGARTVAQDEASSSVYGMPKEARALGAAEQEVGLSDLGPWLQMQLRRVPAFDTAGQFHPA